MKWRRPWSVVDIHTQSQLSGTRCDCGNTRVQTDVAEEELEAKADQAFTSKRWIRPMAQNGVSKRTRQIIKASRVEFRRADNKSRHEAAIDGADGQLAI